MPSAWSLLSLSCLDGPFFVLFCDKVVVVVQGLRDEYNSSESLEPAVRIRMGLSMMMRRYMMLRESKAKCHTSHLVERKGPNTKLPTLAQERCEHPLRLGQHDNLLTHPLPQPHPRPTQHNLGCSCSSLCPLVLIHVNHAFPIERCSRLNWEYFKITRYHPRNHVAKSPRVRYDRQYFLAKF
jgi:hypothetical protein